VYTTRAGRGGEGCNITVRMIWSVEAMRRYRDLERDGNLVSTRNSTQS